jgi:3-oxoacyl-[acyl-carrier protein] reductase
MNVEGRAAIVTGGGTGVGRATALDLGRRGCSVLINFSRSRDEAEETIAEIKKIGVKAVAIQADVADEAACRGIVDRAVKEFGRLDVLVNNAGTTRFIPHDQLDVVKDEDWDHIMAVNVKGPFHCARAAAKAMQAGDGGSIVNVSSVAGIAATGSSIPYCASKAALINMTVALARVLAPRIRVNSVAPGFIDGRWLRNGLGKNYDVAVKAFEARLPLGRVSQPEDVSAAILSLITGSDMVTGQTIVCDSGMLIADFAKLQPGPAS